MGLFTEEVGVDDDDVSFSDGEGRSRGVGYSACVRGLIQSLAGRDNATAREGTSCIGALPYGKVLPA